MSQDRSISAAAAGLATGAITTALVTAMKRAGTVPPVGDVETYERALRILDTAREQDAEVLLLARQLIQFQIAA